MQHYRYHEGDWKWADGEIFIPSKGQLITVCSERKPIIFGRPLICKGEGQWQLAPVEYYEGRFRKIPDADFILLTGATPAIAVALWNLM